MSVDAFIQIDDIAGEALDENYNNWIEITGTSLVSAKVPLPPRVLRAAHRQGVLP